jgi:hypothetical protein
VVLRLVAACAASAIVASIATALLLRDSGNDGPRSPATLTPRTAFAVCYRKWQLQTESLASRARSHAGRTVFRNPPRSVLRARLRIAAARYRFRVRRLTVLRPLGEAPVVVVQTGRPRRFARRLSEVVEAIAPTGHIGRYPDPAYEATYLEALDGRGVPFVAAYRRWRGEAPAGGACVWGNVLPPRIPLPIGQD